LDGHRKERTLKMTRTPTVRSGDFAGEQHDLILGEFHAFYPRQGIFFNMF